MTIAAPNTLDVEELAIFSVIDLIASAASLCEFRTYQNDTRTRAKDWYAWNVEPNQNQNGTEFKRLLFARLLRYNEALVFQRRDGSLYLADTFARNTYAFRPCTYTGVSTNGLTLSYALPEDQVYYFRLANQDAAALRTIWTGKVAHLIDVENDDWYKVSYGSRTGYVFTEYLK